MASSREYLDYILEQLSDLQGITYRYMMGEYILYYEDRVVAGIYDDRFLIKDVKGAREMMPQASLEIPYQGGKPMLLVEDIDDKEFLAELFHRVVMEIPLPKKKSGRLKSSKL